MCQMFMIRNVPSSPESASCPCPCRSDTPRTLAITLTRHAIPIVATRTNEPFITHSMATASLPPTATVAVNKWQCIAWRTNTTIHGLSYIVVRPLTLKYMFSGLGERCQFMGMSFLRKHTNMRVLSARACSSFVRYRHAAAAEKSHFYV